MMNDTELYLKDFGVTVVAPGNVTGKGILDAPDKIIADGLVVSTGYSLTCLSEQFGHLKSGDVVRVSGLAYQVREVRKITDGVFCIVNLSRL